MSKERPPEPLDFFIRTVENRSRHGYHTSTSNATTNRTPNPYTPPEFVAGSRPVHHREPLLHQNPNRGRQPDGKQRPKSVSCMDRFTVQSSYHLRDEDEFPPLSG